MEENKSVSVCGLEFEPITASKAWNTYLWGVGDLATDYHVYEDSRILVLVDRFTDTSDCSLEWACEVYKDGFMGDGYGRTFEDAVANALVDSVGYTTLKELDARERNSEDATNILASNAYTLSTGSDILGDFESMHRRYEALKVLNSLLFSSRQFIKEHGPAYGIEWAEF